jgi:hypothetical protein
MVIIDILSNYCDSLAEFDLRLIMTLTPKFRETIVTIDVFPRELRRKCG